MGLRIGESFGTVAQAGGSIAKFSHHGNATCCKLFDGDHQNSGGLRGCPDAGRWIKRSAQSGDAFDACGGEVVMNLSGSKSRLVGITKELALQWEQTKNYWND